MLSFCVYIQRHYLIFLGFCINTNHLRPDVNASLDKLDLTFETDGGPLNPAHRAAEFSVEGEWMIFTVPGHPGQSVRP
jgi:hypothetical protein